MNRHATLFGFLCLFFGGFWLLGYCTGVEARKDFPQAFRSDEESRVIEVYKRVNEAVVFISTLSRPDPFDFLPEFQYREGSGSGLIVNAEKGIILTNLHVIQDADKVEIFLADGRNYPARLLGHDAEYDLAVLQLLEAPKKLTALSFGDSSQLEVGQRVLAIGNPHGLDRTLTQGIVSSLNRTVRNPNNYLMRGLIQTDAAINPGNSGGPLLDVDGRVIGITTAILSKSGDSAGIGFAVPINQIARILPELITTGRVLRPKLGWVCLIRPRALWCAAFCRGVQRLKLGLNLSRGRWQIFFTKGL